MAMPAPASRAAAGPRGFSAWDVPAALILLGLIVLLAQATRDAMQPLPATPYAAITLDPGALPEYAARTTLRMLAALSLSLLFTFTYATLAAKSRRAERLLVPLLDILQSVPILGFISVTVVFFLSLAPGRMLGAEFAAIFAIFTSQAWNMAFSFYQSLRGVPEELDEAARSFRLNAWARFWRLDVPFAMPPLLWNMMVSMSGGWFFVVAAEAISVGETSVALPGIGSYIALAIAREDLRAVGFAIGAMLLVILAYDQLLFRPLVAWAERFRFAQEPGEHPPRSWVLTMLRRSWLVGSLRAPMRGLWRRTYAGVARPGPLPPGPGKARAWQDAAWSGAILLGAAASVWQVAAFVAEGVGPADIPHAIAAGLATLLRVAILIALASLVWVPLGVWIGLRPGAARLVQPLAQFLAAFPANLLFPVAVSAIIAWRLDPDLWLSPLMILGTQWYILFNVVAGAAAIPPEMRDIATNLRLRGWLWWRRLALPAIFPFYVTGAITASGGSWNASIVAEAVQWGDTRLEAFGLGAYIAGATAAGDMHRVVLGIAVMSALVLATNRLVWRPLYAMAERRCRMG
jgi:NitT/TauT family transport system permease protein